MQELDSELDILENDTNILQCNLEQVGALLGSWREGEESLVELPSQSGKVCT